MKLYLGNDGPIITHAVQPQVSAVFAGINIKVYFTGKHGPDGVLIENMTPKDAAAFAKNLLVACKKHGQHSIKEAEKVLQKKWD